MENRIYTILIVAFLSGCGFGGSFENHKKEEIHLVGYQDGKEVIYQTSLAKFYFGFTDIKEYCKNENNGEDNDFVFDQVIDYISNYPETPILIPDTLGTKMVRESDIYLNDSDSLIRIRDQGHPHAYVTDVIRWMIIEFTRQGNLKIFDRLTGDFVNSVVIDEVDTDLYGSTNIHLPNDSIIFSQFRWIH